MNIVSIQRNAQTEQVMLKSQYQLNFPEENPAFFDFFNHHDVERLSKITSTEIVVYSGESLQCNKEKISVFHDFRVIGKRANRRVVYYFFAFKQKRLYSLKNPPDLSHLPSFAVPYSLQTKAQSVGDTVGPINYAELIEAVVIPDTDASEFIDTSYLLPTVYDCSELDLHSDILFKRWKKQKSVLIVTLCRLLKTSRWKYKSRYKDFYFLTLAAILPSSRDGDRKTNAASIVQADPTVVCIWDVNKACVLNKDFTSQLLQRHFDSTGWKEKRSSMISITGVNHFTEEDRLAAKEEWNKKRLAKGMESSSDNWSELRKCNCDVCENSLKRFGDNMATCGPEKLCTSKYSISNLLKMLGAYDSDAEKDIDRMCELSIAAMDIESKTVELAIGSPLPGANVLYQEIDSAKLEGYSKKIQHPIMIAHVDARTITDARKVFTVANDTPEAAFDMMTEYWNYVLESHCVVQKEKMEIAKKYYTLTGLYRKSFYETANSWFERVKKEYADQMLEARNKDLSDELCEGDARRDYNIDGIAELAEKFEYNPAKIEAAWRSTIPGQLEGALDHLISQYEIFSFYGYDMVSRTILIILIKKATVCNIYQAYK